MHQMLRGSLDQGLKPVPSAFKGLWGCRLLAPQMHQMLRGSLDQGLKPVASGLKGLWSCRLPAGKCIKWSAAAWTKDSSQCPLLLRASEAAVCQPANASTVPWQLQATAVYFSGPPRLPFASRQMHQMLRGSFDQGLKPVPFGFQGLRGCLCQPANASNAPWQLRPRTQASALWF